MRTLEAKLEQLDQEALSDNAQLDSVLKCLSEPLQWLNYETTSNYTPSQQSGLVRHSNWKRHVWTIFKDIIPQWTFALSSIKHCPLIEATLCIKHHKDRDLAYSMAKASLPVLLECLSLNQDESSLDTLTLYASCLNLMSLDSSIFQLYAQFTPQNDIPFFCSLLCSIPGHLANSFGIKLDQITLNAEHEWYTDRNFHAKLSKRITEHLDSKSLKFLQELVSKVIRQGYDDILVKSIYPIARSSRKEWSSLLQPSFDQVIKALLQYIRQDILNTTSINRASKELASILFGPTTTSLHVDEFLNTSLLRLSKASWADVKLARLAICAAIHAQGLDNEKSLSDTTNELILKYTKRVIGTWSDPTFIKHGGSREHTYVTISLLCLVAYISNESLQFNIMGQTSLLPSVTTYFDTGDGAVAQLGAVVAEAISGRCGEPINFGLLDNNQELQSMKDLVNITDAFSDDDDHGETIDPVAELTESESEDDELDPDAIYVPEDEDEEEDSDDEFQAYQMEEESDDEGLKKEGTSKMLNKKPVFIRDVIRYLKDKSDPLKLEIGLNAAEQVVREKTGVGSELSESAVELARNLISVPETFEIDNFQTLVQNALIALIVGVPETVTQSVIDELYDRNTSSGQKQLILGAITLAVRELAGWLKSEDVVEETRKQLESLQPQIGTTVFHSRRMEVEKQNKGAVRKNRLSGLAGPIFFFPLLVGWWEGAQGRIKYWIGNNKLLSERFIMTLNVILHSSTNIPDKRRIVKEYFEFASSMRYADSFGIKKALLLGLDTIVNTSYKGQEGLLFQDFTRELSEVKDWLEEIMENNSESKLQEIAIRVIVRLSQIAMTVNTY
ncbi:unnamed protein product [Mucor hiemalis]